ncbi:Uncharacterised protein [Rodentibacter pneumotropicus]|uniref:Uncharacterized protein n=1 Tax=Rodentibacter pneumotropicus TaxID=758 RepID=A0A3S4XRF9_9PAST|nr:Uncharacterised protein [Rodentibacter pneumotropicus]
MKKFLLACLFSFDWYGCRIFRLSKLMAFQQEIIKAQPDQLLFVERGTTGKKLTVLFEQENWSIMRNFSLIC